MPKNLMPPVLADGKIVFVPCQINPGMASTEREITIRNPGGPIRAYVSTTSVATKTDINFELGKNVEGWVRAVIMAFAKDDIRLLFTGQDVYPSNPAPISPQWLRANAQSEAGFNHESHS